MEMHSLFVERNNSDWHVHVRFDVGIETLK